MSEQYQTLFPSPLGDGCMEAVGRKCRGQIFQGQGEGSKDNITSCRSMPISPKRRHTGHGLSGIQSHGRYTTSTLFLNYL